MSIQKYIKELICLKECVVIPDFGAFVGTYESAKIHSNELISPPTKRITFKKNLTDDDGILIGYISDQEKKDKDLVKKEVQEFVKKLNDEISKGNEICIEEVGCLSLDFKKEIQFRQLKSANLLADSFGLSFIEAEKIKMDPKEDPDLIERRRVRRKKLVTLSIVVPIILFLVGFLFIQTEEFSDFSKLNFFENKEISDVVEVYEEKDTIVEKVIDEFTSKKEALFYQEEVKEPENKLDSFSYYLIAGSFKLEKNAAIFKDELIAEGFDAKVINTDGLHYRISLGAFSSKENALNELEKIHTETSRKTVWLLKN